MLIPDYLTRNERHDENMAEPDKSYDDSWRANEHSKWLLKDGEIIGHYYIKD
jgi:hypothetical protein